MILTRITTRPYQWTVMFRGWLNGDWVSERDAEWVWDFIQGELSRG